MPGLAAGTRLAYVARPMIVNLPEIISSGTAARFTNSYHSSSSFGSISSLAARVKQNLC
jgi:hypothetical protein